ncbi:MAG: thioredoxin family protein [Methanolinea sp.]|nr:thioredoxin family protein [Methanolinea sp.]
MAIRVLYFFQDGCMACHEQEPILAEVEKLLGFSAERIDPLRERAYIRKYRLTVTPTILIERDGAEVARFEGLVHREQLEEAVRAHS